MRNRKVGVQKILESLHRFLRKRKLLMFILGTVLSFLILLAFFGEAFWNSFQKKVTDPDWWADNYLVFLFFGVLIGLYSWWADLWEQKERRKEFEGWKVVVKNHDEKMDDNIYWQDVERILESNLERWRFIKSVVSGLGVVKASTLAETKTGNWISLEEESRTLEIDIDKGVECGHIDRDERRRWPNSRPRKPL